MSILNDIYFRLPYQARCFVASLYGHRLNRWRYGEDTERLVREALEREYWNHEALGEYRERKLAETLSAAVREVPAYMSLYGNSGKETPRLGDFSVLRKEALRSAPRSFVSEKYMLKSLIKIATSGSTGTPLPVYWSKRACLEYYALFEARCRRWYGVTRFDNWAIIGGRGIVASDRREPPFWIWNSSMNQLYLSAYHISGDSVLSMVEAMKKHGVRYVWGYCSALEAISRVMLERSLEPPEVKVAIGNAEPLLERQREIIGRAFHCRVTATYGMTEIVAGGTECEHGNLHSWDDLGIIEILDGNGAPVSTGETGTMVCTGLLNDAMPLIRYDVGDRGALEPESFKCPCGRNFRVIRAIEGRLDDVVVTPDGRRIGRLDTVFKSDFAIRRAQIIQEDEENLTILVEPAGDYGENDERLITRELREKVGSGMKIKVEKTESIPLSAGGKFRGVVSRVSERKNG